MKKVKVLGENTKVSIRNARRDTNEAFKQMKKNGLSEDQEKDAEAKVQDMTNKYTEKVDVLINDSYNFV